MSEQKSSRTGTRFERRRAQTRRSLIAAARVILAEENAMPEASIQRIAEQADVGFGSFFNHFENKSALFDAAVADALEEYGQLLDEVTAVLDDPAQVIAANVRLTIGMVGTHPELAKILRHRGMAQLHAESGLAPRALRDIEVGAASGRFTVDSPDIALSAVGGALLGLLELGSHRPEVVSPEAAERTAALVLRMLGLSAEDADDVARRPLPQAPAPRA
ncbi:TetR/AcrR family transcriptional regulator [Streptomyces physcomitrii]|uniref:TetR/AcrR family transcriptional regulator n=1 Tax=Streptomyces physcomitrii TaxID=2724184 RepID=A0ABX1H214_9ACTN|nr:TetR/AcrR family transcriptional regulator [Streptomyces physcomitrii]NKI42097.1 TetR/AcrR family transcriptional regulator [Streptomyces physcomitrii]